MENPAAPPDSPKPLPPTQTIRDPLIRYSVFAALGCAAACMVFTILYVFSYSLDSTLSFERHFDAYLTSGNTGNLSTVLGLHMAQNRMFLQSCGMVAGIFFACLGLALFLVGIQGTTDATGQVRDYATSLRRLAPGGIILLASMIFVGVSAMHPIDLTLTPVGTSAAAAIATPAAAPATATQTLPLTPIAPSNPQPTTQSENTPAQPARPTPQPAAQQQSAQPTAQPPQLEASLSTPQPPVPQPSAPQPQAYQPTRPSTTSAPRPISRPALLRVALPTSNSQPPLHHFQP